MEKSQLYEKGKKGLNQTRLNILSPPAPIFVLQFPSATPVVVAPAVQAVSLDSTVVPAAQ